MDALDQGGGQTPVIVIDREHRIQGHFTAGFRGGLVFDKEILGRLDVFFGNLSDAVVVMGNHQVGVEDDDKDNGHGGEDSPAHGSPRPVDFLLKS